MKTKNLFWFLKEPLDERENALFGLAYGRAFKFNMLALALILIISSKVDFVISSSVIFFVVLSLLAATDIVGWFTIRNEDISDIDHTTKKSPLWLIYTLPLVCASYVIATAFIFPRTSDMVLSVIIGCGLICLLLISYSFTITKGLPLYARLILSVLFPLFSIFFVTSKKFKESKFKAAMESIGYNLLIMFIFAFLIIFLRLIIISPFYSQTDHFAPEISKGQYLLVNKFSRDYETGDHVIFFSSEKRFVIGKVESKVNNMVILDTASGKVEIEQDKITGKIIK